MAVANPSPRYQVVEFDKIDEFQSALNNPPEGYGVDGWNVVYWNGIVYTVVYKKAMQYMGQR